jgi:hypothetical protein
MLPLRSIGYFDDLRKMFLTQLMAGIVKKKHVGSLMSLHQGPDESLKDFLMRFNQEKIATKNLTEEFVYCALFQGIKKDGPLMANSARKPPHNLHGFMERAEEFINLGRDTPSTPGVRPSLDVKF